MGYWIYMMAVDLIIPAIMIILGKYFLKRSPKKINHIFGYRTSMSMKNKNTWDYAHKLLGKLWYRYGLIILPVSILIMLMCWGRSEAIVSMTGLIVCSIQSVVIVLTAYSVEKGLKRKFDENGIERTGVIYNEENKL